MMKVRKIKRTVFVLVIIALLFSSCQQTDNKKSVDPTQEFDVVILNGRVMDPETNFDSICNVGVKDGKIAILTTNLIAGKKTINASGMVVSPGFVDGHAHIVDAPLGQKALLRDGVTSAMDLEVGAFPIDTWYNNLKGRSQLNYGATVSAGGARTKVFKPDYESITGNIQTDMFSGVDVGNDWSNRIMTPDEQVQFFGLIETGLKRGALGVGPPIGYMTTGFMTEDLIGIQKLVGKYGRFTHIHVRFMSQAPPTSALLAVQEAIDPAVAYGGGVIIAHIQSNSLAESPEVVQYIRDMQSKGVKVIGEAYPYNIAAAGAGISSDYLAPENYQRNMGRTYSDIIDTQTGKRLDKETYEKLIKEDPFHPVMFYTATDEDMMSTIGAPDVLIGCDCFQFTDPKTGKRLSDWDTPWETPNTHPRTSGTHALMLRLTREKKLDLTLMQTISKMSYDYAKFLQDNGVAQMAFKGRVQEGSDADITIFDPATVTDNATFEQGKNALPSTGIPYVLVNGNVIVDDSKVLKDVYPGQPIRNPIVN